MKIGQNKNNNNNKGQEMNKANRNSSNRGSFRNVRSYFLVSWLDGSCRCVCSWWFVHIPTLSQHVQRNRNPSTTLFPRSQRNRPLKVPPVERSVHHNMSCRTSAIERKSMLSPWLTVFDTLTSRRRPTKTTHSCCNATAWGSQRIPKSWTVH